MIQTQFYDTHHSSSSPSETPESIASRIVQRRRCLSHGSPGYNPVAIINLVMMHLSCSVAAHSCSTSAASDMLASPSCSSAMRASGRLIGLLERSDSAMESSGGENDHTLEHCQHHINNQQGLVGGRLTSMMVRSARLAMITAFSSSKATLQTACAGVLSSRTSWPVRRSHTLTRPSLPPLTTRVSSN